jgi:hypothetical protein
MEEDMYINMTIEKLKNTIELLKSKKYFQVIQLSQSIYNQLQEKFPLNIPAVYLKHDILGFSRWKNKEFMQVGVIIQKLTWYLYKKKYINLESVVAYIEGAEQMAFLSEIETQEYTEALIAVYMLITLKL